MVTLHQAPAYLMVWTGGGGEEGGTRGAGLVEGGQKRVAKAKRVFFCLLWRSIQVCAQWALALNGYSVGTGTQWALSGHSVGTQWALSGYSVSGECVLSFTQ